MGFGIVCMVIGAGFIAAWAWLGVEAWRDDRALVRAERESVEEFERSRPETEAAMARSAARIPSRDHILRASVQAECLDEAGVTADANLLIAAATGLCRTSAEQFANARLLDEYATKYPMQVRPRLVDRAESESNLGGENS